MDGGEDSATPSEERFVGVHGGDDVGVCGEGEELLGGEVVFDEDAVEVALFFEPGDEDVGVRG